MKQYFLIMAAVICSAIFMGCDESNTLEGSEKKTTESDVEEAVYRYLFGQLASLQPHAFYLELHGKNPSGAFMDRFLGNNPQVKTKSESTSGANGQVIDKMNGLPGVLLSIDSVSSATSEKAAAKGGYLANNDNISRSLFTLENRDGRWIVTKDDKF